jgi:hypothetical protein
MKRLGKIKKQICKGYYTKIIKSTGAPVPTHAARLLEKAFKKARKIYCNLQWNQRRSA